MMRLVRNSVVGMTVAVLLVPALSSCSDQMQEWMDDAMADGCNGLRTMVDAYHAGDRTSFDAIRQDTGTGLGIASELSADFPPESKESLNPGGAYWAYKLLTSKGFWRRERISQDEQHVIDQGLRDCEAY